MTDFSTGAPFDVDDLRLLEPTYLRHAFDPRAYGFDEQTLAQALAGAGGDTLDYLSHHVKEGLRPAIDRARRQALAPDVAGRSRHAARRLVDDYAFHLAYRKYPVEYERFSQAQDFALDVLFPASIYDGRTVLDIGCGTGKLLDYLAPVAARVIGLDAAAAVLTVARRKHMASRHVVFLQGTFQVIPLADASVEMIVSNMAFPSHAEVGGGPQAVRELLRVVRPGGEVRMTVYDVAAERLLRNSGFTITRIENGVVYRAGQGDSVVVRHLRELALGGQRAPQLLASPVTLCVRP